MLSKKIIGIAIGLVATLLFSILLNPLGWNDGGNRVVITKASGKQEVQFKPGVYWSGFFSKTQVWPNQISVSYREDKPDYDLVDNTIEIGKLTIRFSDGPTALTSGITQYILPNNEEEMLAIHNTHKTPEALVSRRLAPYTQECLQNSAQLLTTEMHYGGGRAQMAQDYLDQLKNGAFLLEITETNIYDTIEKTNKKTYQSVIQYEPNKIPKRKFSSIKEYGVTVADAQITDVDYEKAVDNLLKKKIEASTDASVSRQRLMTAQQQKLTAEAEGQKRLVEIEYQQKQEQTKLVVAAQTQVELARQDKLKQQIAMEASSLEAAKIKTLADAKAYEKAKIMAADGALEKKLATYEKVNDMWSKAFGSYTGSVVPNFVMGSSGNQGNAAINFMEMMNAKTAMDLNNSFKITSK